MNVPKNDRDIYRSNTTHTEGVNQSLTNRNMINMELTSARVPSPHQVRFFFKKNSNANFQHAYRTLLIYHLMIDICRMFVDQVRCIIF